MAIRLKQSTASQEIPLGPFLDDTDGKTAETGLTIANTDIKLWVPGATTLANKTSGGATHISGGIYYCVLDATDTATLGSLVAFIHVAGALPVRVECEVMAANVYDSLVGGTDNLQVDAVQVTGTAQTAGDIYARLGAPAGASMSADIAAVKEQTAAIETDTGTDLPATLATVAGYLDTEIAAIKAKTDNLPASPAAVGSAMTLTSGERDSVADALLNRDMSTGTDSGSPTVRTVRQALRFLRNKWSISGTTLTVTKEDDATSSWTSTVTATAGADPITGNDPA